MDQLLVTLLSLHYYIITLLSCKFTVNDNMIWYICLGSISKDFTKNELSEQLNIVQFKNKTYLIFTNI